MKLCYLILAHHAPEQLGRLVDALTQGPGVEEDQVVVHVDRRVEIADFTSRVRSPAAEFITERTAVTWSGWSMVEADLALVRGGLKSAPDADYFFLISGDTFPLFAPSGIKDLVTASPQTERIQLVAMPAPEVGKPLERLTEFHLPHDMRTSRLRPLYAGVRRVVRRNPARALKGWQPYGGSHWWGLTREAIRHALDQSDKNPAWARFCRNTQLPEEHFLHTILGNSEFTAHAIGSPMWADWSAGRGSPEFLGLQHLEQLRTGGSPDATPPLFGRKFPAGSEAVCAAIQRDLWSRPVL